MEIGFNPIGFAASADPLMITKIARKAEEVGFSTVWTGEHVATMSDYTSRYPYSADGKAPLPSMDIEILDAFVSLTYAAAHTETIRLGTGVSILPMHNPVILAKTVASVDKVSRGRVVLGIGVGWLQEEFEALGVPWPRRGKRADEYIRVMKELWSEGESNFEGEFCNFSGVHLYPKPVQRPHPPLIIGGNSDAALQRAGQLGDGWYGYEVSPSVASDMIERIRKIAADSGRDPAELRFVVSPGFNVSIGVQELEQYHQAGVDEILFTSIQTDPDLVDRNLDEIAEQLIPTAKAIG